LNFPIAITGLPNAENNPYEETYELPFWEGDQRGSRELIITSVAVIYADSGSVYTKNNTFYGLLAELKLLHTEAFSYKAFCPSHIFSKSAHFNSVSLTDFSK
jgi:hypothetical protein